ncbi:MAG: DUF58 domain-containing protein [Verrucomicrobia bacterium]|nr:DUF58 domain-containing protein [Verrucomicrobiota bacterium]MCF7709097.1 DUF58 domain-containing protein [Verrucomicrobiota bacterium]
MIPRNLIKKIRQIEIKTSRFVNEAFAGRYHSVFKGQGMDFEEVREYFPGDDVRAIDWNVTARMNHPFVKKFTEERELTLVLLVDMSSSGKFGSGEQTKRELAAELASVLAFSAIRNNDKVGLVLFTDKVEKFVPPAKGRRHVLRVIREILYFEPEQTGTNLNAAIEFMMRVLSRSAIAVVISDFLVNRVDTKSTAATGNVFPVSSDTSLAHLSFNNLKRANRRHDMVVVHITDKLEWELPALGRIILKDAETGEVVEINTNDEHKRRGFNASRNRAHKEFKRLMGIDGIDVVQLQTDTPYIAVLSQFFETREKRRRRL